MSAPNDWSPAVWEICVALAGEGVIPTPAILKAELPDTPPRVIDRALLRWRMRNERIGF